MKNLIQKNEVSDAIVAHKKAFWVVACFSFVINFLYLAPSIYMLQIYDRVLTSRSEFTLLMLTILVAGMYGIMAFSEYIRSQILIRVGNAVDQVMSKRVFTATFESNLRNGNSNSSVALSDLNNVRQFVTGNGLFAFLDVPWFPIYLTVIYLLHPSLGVLALVGAVILIGLAYANEKLSKEPLEAANQHAVLANNFASSNLRNAEVIEAMGMLQPLMHRWYKNQSKMLEQQTIASNRAANISAVTRFVRLLLQSGGLCLGALLVISGDVTPGVMIAASILIGRTLAPVELLIGTWRTFSSARTAFERLTKLLEMLPERKVGMSLPPPRGEISLENVFCTPPGGKSAVLKSLNFKILTGDVVGIIGASASGKSTLARLIVGVWPAQVGKVRLDGADIYQWNKDELGPHIGYLPQDIELFNGTVAENIARFSEINSAEVVNAANRSGVHQMIFGLSNGYDTQIGDGGNILSGGQKQRLGIARALYGSPSLIVLDEPNSNLDDVGEAALVQTIKELKTLGKTVVIVTHRPNILQVVDKLLVMKDGSILTYGPKDQVLQVLAKGKQQIQQSSSDVRGKLSE
jgi:ATP-binding cassette subfamily C exporter for protease/lipase